MDPLSFVASLITILDLTFTVVEYINDVKDSRQERIRLRDEITSASGTLHMLYDRIKREQKRMDEDPDGSGQSWMSSVMTLGVPKGPLEQFKEVLDELAGQMSPPTGNGRMLRKLGKSLAWSFQRRDIERYISVIERKKALFLLALQNDSITLTQAVKDDIQAVKGDTKLIPGIASDVTAVAVKLDEIALNETVSENRVIIDWLSPLNFFRSHDSILSRRTPDTGLWFLNSPKYRSWVDSLGGTMWCPGIPGAGKTVLSSIVVDNLRHRFEAVPGIGVASVYCNYKEESEQTLVNLLAGLWLQLIQRCDQLSDDVLELYHKHVDNGTLPKLAEVERVLNTEVGRYKKVFIIVDALDECAGSIRVEFLRRVQALQPKVNLLATSRFDDTIACAFENCPRLPIGASTEDVRTYVSSRISGQLAKHTNRDPSLAREIEEAVVTKAQNMFLLAQLQLDSLQEKSSPKAVRKALITLPNDLDRMYDETLFRIESQSEDYRQLAKQILEWIVFAVRPLSMNELQEALAVEEGTQEIDQSNVVDPELITSVCAGLVVLDQASSMIRLVHFSTQEYFKRIRFARFPAAQIHIGKICLTYLSFQDFAHSTYSDHQTIWLRTQKHPLLRYAAEYWGEHVRGGSEKDLESQVMEFLNDERKLLCAVEVLHLTAPARFPGFMSRLHLAAHFGLENTVNALLRQGDSISARDWSGATALHRAVEAGQKSVVQLLLEHGTDIQAEDLSGHNAIHKATISRQTEIALLLLTKGANISEAIDGRTALHFAAETGNVKIITALLEAGAEVNAVSNDMGEALWRKFFAGRTPLHWAAQNGHLAATKVLHEHGAKVNVLNCTNRTPLQEAIMFDRTPVIRYLLNSGASVAIKDDCGWTPLHEAAYQSSRQVAQMLIDLGAKIDPITISTPVAAKLPGVQVDFVEVQVGCTPLHLAAARGNFDVFELLKSHGADIQFCDSSGLVPIHRTVQAGPSSGSLQVVQCLLNSGVDIDVRDKRRQETTLQMASRLGMVGLIEYLLERGANIAATNRFGETALQLAEAGGHVEAVRVLIEYGMRR